MAVDEFSAEDASTVISATATVWTGRPATE